MADLQTLLNKFLASLYGGFGTGVTYLPGGVLSSQITPVSNVSTTETDLMSYTLPANALSADGKGVRVTAFGTSAANGNTKTARLYFGATLVATQVFTSSASSWHIVADIVRTGAATQTAGAYIITALFVGTTFTTAPTETLSGAVVIKATGQSGTGSSDVTQTGMLVEALA